MVFKDGKCYVEYLGEICEVIGVDEDQEFVYLEGSDTVTMIRYKYFKEKFLQNA